jgi:hypothetical protein
VCAKTADATRANPDPALIGEQSTLLRLADRVGELMQLRCPGFLSNWVQHRQFGLAVLQMAQKIRRDFLAADDAAAALSDAVDPSDGGVAAAALADADPATGAANRTGWRATLQIAATWRQISEPNTSVFWIDEMPEEAFKSGFGLETLLEAGCVWVAQLSMRLRDPRLYSEYCLLCHCLALSARAISQPSDARCPSRPCAHTADHRGTLQAVARRPVPSLLRAGTGADQAADAGAVHLDGRNAGCSKWSLPSSMVADVDLVGSRDLVQRSNSVHGCVCALVRAVVQIAAAKTPVEVLNVVGQDFWVVNRCVSSYVPGRVMEGTRLTLQVGFVPYFRRFAVSSLFTAMLTVSHAMQLVTHAMLYLVSGPGAAWQGHELRHPNRFVSTSSCLRTPSACWRPLHCHRCCWPLPFVLLHVLPCAACQLQSIAQPLRCSQPENTISVTPLAAASPHSIHADPLGPVRRGAQPPVARPPPGVPRHPARRGGSQCPCGRWWRGRRGRRNIRSAGAAFLLPLGQLRAAHARVGSHGLRRVVRADARSRLGVRVPRGRNELSFVTIVVHPSSLWSCLGTWLR